MHRDARITSLVRKHWGDVEGAATAAMQKQLERLEGVLRTGSGSPYPGKKLFKETCAKCHQLFGQGGQVGPDLTTFKRDDLSNVLLHVVNPSAEIREGYETLLATTKDGRVLTGLLVDKDNRVVVLRGADGQTVTLRQEQIEEMQPQRKSLMPEGLLDPLTDQQVRDLFAYLRSTQPLND
jgi:putative heme-binding domain-containing protein